jgi:uroporphyrinogen decarboxylase
VNQRNPTIAEARHQIDKALIGGVDEAGALQHGTPGEVLAEAHAAIEAGRGGRFLLAPGCGVAMDAPPANLQALRRSVEQV